MPRSYTHSLFPSIEGIQIKPVLVQLYVPPITWKGDPKGHIGRNDAFFFVVSGECYVSIEDECFIVRAGQLAFLPKGKMRTYTAMSTDLTMYEINFACEINGEYWFDFANFKSKHYQIDVSDTAYLSRLFEETARYEYNKNVLYDVIFCTNIAAIVKYYIVTLMEIESKEQPFIEVIRYMRGHLDQQIKVDELAKVACMQTTYFIRKFKLAFGVSPITYLNKLKMYRAMTLLSSTDLSIDEVAKKVGIFDNSYFSRMFKNYCSTTPSEYRSIFMS